MTQLTHKTAATVVENGDTRREPGAPLGAGRQLRATLAALTALLPRRRTRSGPGLPVNARIVGAVGCNPGDAASLRQSCTARAAGAGYPHPATRPPAVHWNDASRRPNPEGRYADVEGGGGLFGGGTPDGNPVAVLTTDGAAVSPAAVSVEEWDEARLRRLALQVEPERSIG